MNLFVHKGLELIDQRNVSKSHGRMFKRALELDPNLANITGNYATFLASQHKDLDAAETMFKKTLELDPNRASHTGNYALFLKNARKDFEAAEAMFKKVLELDPSHATNTGNYANFLEIQRKDLNAAEAMFKKALDLDPGHVVNTGNYATFLADQRKDFDAAEAMFKRALTLDPNNANITSNYASMLLTRGDDESLGRVLPLVHLVLNMCRPNVNQAVAESLMYGALVQIMANNADPAEMLSRLKSALHEGYMREFWDFSAMFAQVLPRLQDSQSSLFQALGGAILDADRLSKLNAIEIWRDLQPKEVFAPF